MSILLPSSPGIRTAKPRLLDFGGVLTPDGGGASQRLNRLGNRYQIDIEVPPFRDGDPNGRIFLSRLRRALTQGALYPFPQPGLVIGSPGSPLVNGTSSSGTTLALKSLAAGYLIREGQFMSIIHGGRRYLHAAAGGDWGNGPTSFTMTLDPMLRTALSDGDVIEIAQPMIEGWISGTSIEWLHQLDPFTQATTFTITEAS